jgi:hypothetical protein
LLQADQTVRIVGHDAVGDLRLASCFSRLSRWLTRTKRRVAARVPFFCRRFLRLA